jgi:hypothetical protein
MADVFLSYARQERAKAERIKDLLEATGLSVFFDVEGLDGGDAFPDVLDHEVKTAGVVLGLWSPSALSRPWVKIECRIAMDRGVLIPVLIQPINQLTDVPAAFYNLQHIDLSDFSGDPADFEWRKVLKSIGRTLKQPGLAGPQSAAIEPPPRPQANRAASLLGACLAAMVLGGGALLWWRPWEARSVATTDPAAPPSVDNTVAPSAAASAPDVQPTTQTGSRADLDALKADLGRINFLDPRFVLRTTMERLLKVHSIEALERAAKGDSPQAALLLAHAHLQGAFVTADPGKASALYLKACDGGLPAGCTGVGLVYQNASEPPDHAARARTYYAKGCDGADLWGCTYLGILNAWALGGPLDYDKARALYERACGGGLFMACTNLGLMDQGGQGGGGVPNIPKARAMFEKACEGGEPTGCGNLGFMYGTGQGVDRDPAKAVGLFQKSCSGGFVGGCSYLGYHLATGLGVAKDEPKGRALLQQGCSVGYQMACNGLKSLPN